MEDFIAELKTLKVVLKEDIIRIGHYIENKYPHYDHQKKDEILTNAIGSIVNRHLKDFPGEYHQQIQQQLFMGPLGSKENDLFLFDIFDAAIELAREESDLFQGLRPWVNAHIRNPIDDNEIKKYSKGKELIWKIKSANALNLNEAPTRNSTSPAQSTFTKNFFSRYKATYIIISLLSIFFLSQLILIISADAPQEIIIISAPTVERQYPHLPENFYYKDIDEVKLKAYLETRNSLLVEAPYFSTIINVARDFELNPLVLFAVAGHEQGFVPKDHPSAAKIVNNPYNVFNSWQHYNTDIDDASRIAARTIINSSKERPEEIDPFQWINRRYAEDQNWWKGVSSLYYRLEKEVE